MKFGVNTLIWTAHFDRPHLDLIPRIAVHGFDSIEIARFNWDDFPAAEIRKAAAVSGEATTRSRMPKMLNQIRRDLLAGLDEDLRKRLTNFYRNNRLQGNATPAEQAARYVSLAYALGHLPASVVSPTMVLQPIVTTLLAIPLLGEIPSIWQGIGGAIALVGIYVVNQSHNRRQLEPPTPNA